MAIFSVFFSILAHSDTLIILLVTCSIAVIHIRKHTNVRARKSCSPASACLPTSAHTLIIVLVTRSSCQLLQLGALPPIRAWLLGRLLGVLGAISVSGGAISFSGDAKDKSAATSATENSVGFPMDDAVNGMDNVFSMLGLGVLSFAFSIATSVTLGRLG